MAAVLQFENKRKQVPMQSSENRGPSRIILFTGVRFERLETASDISEIQESKETNMRNRAV